jgi:hypothetical protein
MTPLKTFDPSGVPCYFENERKFRYHRIALLDSASEKITPVLRSTCELIDRARHYGSVLVHCNQGVSRSAAICCAYLIRYRGMSLSESLAFIRKRRPSIRPNEGFIAQLQSFEEDVTELRRLGGILPPEPLESASVGGSCDEVSDAETAEAGAQATTRLAGSKRSWRESSDGGAVAAAGRVKGSSAAAGALSPDDVYGPQASPMPTYASGTAASNATSQPELLCEECGRTQATVHCSACLVAYCSICDAEAHSLVTIGEHAAHRQAIMPVPHWQAETGVEVQAASESSVSADQADSEPFAALAGSAPSSSPSAPPGTGS